MMLRLLWGRINTNFFLNKNLVIFSHKLINIILLMTKLRKNNLVFISSAAIAIVLFFLFILAWYNNVVDGVVKAHQTTQTQIANTVGISAFQFFEHLKDHIDRIRHEYNENDDFIGNPNVDLDEDLKEFGIEDFLISDGDETKSIFNNTHSFEKKLLIMSTSASQIIDLGSVDSSHSVKYLFNRVFIDEDNGDSLRIAALLDTKKLLQKLTEPLELSPLDYVWVLNESGTLIYHPKHEEMINRNIFKSRECCWKCHDSFLMQRRIFENKSGKEIYFVGNEDKKVMAYRHFKYENLDWSISIATHYDKIVEDYSDQYRFITFVSIVVFFVIIVSFTSNYFLNIKRIIVIEKSNRLAKEKSIQDNLEHTSKLASLGELIDTVVHEINTPLGVIQIQLDLLNLSGKAEGAEELVILKKQVDRLTNYTGNLLNYSRRLPFDPRLNNIIEVLDESLSLVGHKIRKKKIKLFKEFQDDMPLINFDRMQIEQVLVNILNNAIDATKEGGEVMVLAKVSFNTKISNSIPNLVIHISDDGNGIPKESFENIFDAFFTTKEPGKGTGLGLYISKNIIHRHKGTIKAYKNYKFTTFEITLPA